MAPLLTVGIMKIAAFIREVTLFVNDFLYLSQYNLNFPIKVINKTARAICFNSCGQSMLMKPHPFCQRDALIHNQNFLFDWKD